MEEGGGVHPPPPAATEHETTYTISALCITLTVLCQLMSISIKTHAHF